jgi:hypothetical protein
LEVLPKSPPSSISNTFNSKSMKPSPPSGIDSWLDSSSSPFPHVSRVRVKNPPSASRNQVHIKHVNESPTQRRPRVGISDMRSLNPGRYRQDGMVATVPESQGDRIVFSVPAGRADPLQPPTAYSQPSFAPLAKESRRDAANIFPSSCTQPQITWTFGPPGES